MTDEAVTSAEKAPDGHYFTTLKGREILVRVMNPAQHMVLGGLFRQLEGMATADQALPLFGKIMRLVESLIPRKDDLEWLEAGILDAEIDVPDFALIFLPATTEPGPAKKVKPRRGK